MRVPTLSYQHSLNTSPTSVYENCRVAQRLRMNGAIPCLPIYALMSSPLTTYLWRLTADIEALVETCIQDVFHSSPGWHTVYDYTLFSLLQEKPLYHLD